LTALRFFLPFCLILSLAGAETIKLYMTDGTYQLTREYKVEGDRVHYYSTERGEWEDMPVDLVDLKKTEKELKSREEAAREENATQAAEAKAEREAARELLRVPKDPGVYVVDGEAVNPVKQAESKIVNNNGRTVLKILSPLPVVSGKQWVEVDGKHSATIVTNPRQEFYFRLSNEERFGLVRMGEHKGNRVVEKLTIVPVIKDVMEEADLVDTFRLQLGDLIYKIWPEKDLSPGEYALVEYTEGKVNMQVWDFAYRPGK
jgi:hypothetical protein